MMNPAKFFGWCSCSAQWWALVVLQVLCFALGGSARGDVAQLVVLRPAAVLLLGFALVTLRADHLRAHPLAWLMVTATAILPALQLIPLPPELWRLLPNRELIAEIDRAAGLNRVWRPLSLTPLATYNALFASVVPLAAFVLGVQLDERDRARLLPAILVMGGLTALVGMVQILRVEADWFHLYSITNHGSAVGLFANRNHQAMLLAMLLPMLAAYGYCGDARARLAALVGGALLIPLILAIGSRSGLLLAVAALIAIPLILAGLSREAGKAAGGRRIWGRFREFAASATGIAGVALVALTIWLGRDEAWTRLTHTVGGVDQRWQILPSLGRMFADHFPVGTGMGSFERVFQIYEPDVQLGPLLLNHAHNDWIEVVLDGGLYAAVLLGAAALAFALRCAEAWRGRGGPAEQRALARLGLVLIGLGALASLFDYPLRTPIHATVFAIAVLWSLAGPRPALESKLLDRQEIVTHRGALAEGDRGT